MPASAKTIQPDDVDGAYRSGVAARLAGLPVETLRVWERRYSVSATQRSAHGQRLYSGAQVRRLSLIKQLVDQGHPIGALANLPLEQLRKLLLPEDAGAPRGPIRVALVGQGLARRLAAGGRDLLALDVLRSCAGLDGAEEALRGSGADVLLVEMSELLDTALPQIVALRQRLGPVAVVVLYRFCASATIRQLRAHGCLVARAPADLAEIVLLCQAALAGPAPSSGARRLGPVTPRRLDEQALATLAEASNSLQCDCPRHLTEILLMVGSFERYSTQCADRTSEDAQMHQELGQVAGQARMLLEAALERLARVEGLPLPAGLPPALHSF